MNFKNKILFAISFIIFAVAIVGTVYCPWAAFLLPIGIIFPLYFIFKKIINKSKIIVL